MRPYSRLAVTAASLLALSALGGIAGHAASAQPPPSDTATAEPELVEADVVETEEEGAEEPSDDTAPSGGGSAAAVPAQLLAPTLVTVPTEPPAPAQTSPDTAPLGSDGGGTGGNGRPTQDPVKDR